jgi:hypothetical protein
MIQIILPLMIWNVNKSPFYVGLFLKYYVITLVFKTNCPATFNSPTLFPLYFTMSGSLQDLLNIIILQEEKCEFTSFTSDDALALGLLLIDNVKPFKKSVVIDITLNGHQLFHYAMAGTSKDNDEWGRRKK